MYNPIPQESSVQIPEMARAPLPVWKEVLFVFLPSLVVFVALDVAWISMFAGAVYKEVLGNALRPSPDILPGVLAWLCIVGALHLFVLGRSRTLNGAAMQGALMGMCLYGCYEFTNQSILTAWTWGLSLTDIAWGSSVSAAVSAVQHILYAKVSGR